MMVKAETAWCSVRCYIHAMTREAKAPISGVCVTIIVNAPPMGRWCLAMPSQMEAMDGMGPIAGP